MAGGRSSKTNTVMRTAKTASEIAFTRSGVALAWNTIILLGVSARLCSCSLRAMERLIVEVQRRR